MFQSYCYPTGDLRIIRLTGKEFLLLLSEATPLLEYQSSCIMLQIEFRLYYHKLRNYAHIFPSNPPLVPLV